jgi:antitoxin component of RelBE/YafQ-DinJ toxin-antitoxin module
MKTYNVNLDEETIKALDRWLAAAGMTRSGYINTLLTKTVESMGLKQIPDYDKMTLPQLFKMLGGVGAMMEGKSYGVGKKK